MAEDKPEDDSQLYVGQELSNVIDDRNQEHLSASPQLTLHDLVIDKENGSEGYVYVMTGKQKSVPDGVLNIFP